MIIICENGCNFKDIKEAKLMIKRAKEITDKTGVKTLSKFQIFNESNIRDANPEYQEFLRSITLDYEKAKELFEYGKSIKQEVFFTPMFLEAVDWCEYIGVNYYKIRFKDQDNLELIDYIFNDMELLFTTEKIFISTDSPNLYHRLGFIPFSCVPKYPAKFEDYYSIRRHFEKTYYQGISDHTPDFELLEYALKWEHLREDVYYFEKHVCLTKDCLESQWSSTFKELEEVLEHNSNLE